MHLGIISRGRKRDVDRFIEEIQAKYVPIKVKGKDMRCSIVYRPIQLGELIFPETSLQNVLATLEPMNWRRKSFALEQLRKALGYERTPELDGKTLPYPVWDKNIELNLLGIKRDRIDPDQENL